MMPQRHEPIASVERCSCDAIEKLGRIGLNVDFASALMSTAATCVRAAVHSRHRGLHRFVGARIKRSLPLTHVLEYGVASIR
jgi:hypothetical protein